MLPAPTKLRGAGGACIALQTRGALLRSGTAAQPGLLLLEGRDQMLMKDPQTGSLR